MNRRELSQLYWLKKEIAQQEERLQELQSIAEGCTSKLTACGCNGVTDKIGNYAVKIAMLQNEIQANRIKCVDEYKRLVDYINSIPDSLTRQIFTLRFVDGMSWSNVAMRVSYLTSEDCVKKTVYRYLKEC